MTTLENRPTVEVSAESNSDKGPGTRRRLLDTASRLFAGKGYRGVSVRDICDQACTNIAAVNYHFGGKDKLYQAALAHARQRAVTEPDPCPPIHTASGRLTPELKLRRHLRAMLGRVFTQGPAGWYLQMVMRELVDPTPTLKQTLDENIAPHQRRLEAILAQVLKDDADSDRVKDTAAMMLGTVVYYQNCQPAIEHMRPDFTFDQPAAERITNHLLGMVGCAT